MSFTLWNHNSSLEANLYIKRTFGTDIIVPCPNHISALDLANSLVSFTPDRDTTFPKYRKSSFPSMTEIVHVSPRLQFLIVTNQYQQQQQQQQQSKDCVIMNAEEATVLFLKPDSEIVTEPTEQKCIRKLTQEASKTALQDYVAFVLLVKDTQKKQLEAQRHVSPTAKTRIWLSRIWDSNDLIIECENRATGYDLAYKILLTHELLNRDMSGHTIHMHSTDVYADPLESHIIASTEQIQIAFISGIDLPDLTNWVSMGHKSWRTQHTPITKPYILISFEDAETYFVNPRRYPLFLKKHIEIPFIITENPQIGKFHIV